MNIVVTNVKGGVGKTTTTMYLAAAAASRGREAVLVIDADRQASSAEWFDAMPLDEVELVEAPSERTVTRAMGRHGGIAVVDTRLVTSGSCGPPSPRLTPSSSRRAQVGWRPRGWWQPSR